MAKLVSYVLLAILAMAGWSSPALAQLVPGGDARVVCQVVEGGIAVQESGGVFPLGPASCNLPSFAEASIATQPFVLLTAQVNAGLVGSSQRNAAVAVVALEYWFTVTGGTPGDLVPILVHTQMTTDVTPSLDPNNANSASANVNLFGLSGPDGGIISTGPFAAACSMSPGPASCSDEFEGNLEFTMASGTTGLVYMQIIVGASANSGGAASASIDPFIFVDPLFANAADYSITVSDGVANAPPVSGVPEPGVWALLLAGLGGLGVTLRRRVSNLA